MLDKKNSDRLFYSRHFNGNLRDKRMVLPTNFRDLAGLVDGDSVNVETYKNILIVTKRDRG